MGVRGPRYLGSDEAIGKAAPFLDLDYKGIVGFQPSKTLDRTLGFYCRPFEAGPWQFSLLVMAEGLERREKDAGALKGMGDRKRGLFLGVQTTLRTEPVEASVEVMKGNDGAGLVAGLTLSHGFHFGERLGLELGIAGIWGDKAYYAWEFGITPAQASRRGALLLAGDPDLRPADARPFTPSAGLREFRAEAMLQWRVTDRLMGMAMLQHGQLLKDAAMSPLTRSKTQTSFGLGFVYLLSGGGHGH